MTVVIFGWVLFRSESLLSSVRYILRMVLPWRYGFSNMFTLSIELTGKHIFVLVVAFIGCGLLQALSGKVSKTVQKWKYSKVEVLYLALVFIYCLTLLTAGTYNPFIYFRF